jgi:hypothetical protein
MRGTKAMIRVFFSNFGHFAEPDFDSVYSAIAYAKSNGFDASIHKNGSIVATWSLFSGVKWYQGEFEDWS